MAKRDKTQDALDALGKLRGEVDHVILRTQLEAALRGGNHVVAKAVKIAGEKKVHDLTPAIRDAYQRFVEDPIKTDPGCPAKTEIVRFLIDQSERCEDLYLHAARHRQIEPGWPDAVDTAAELRGLGAMGLVCIASRKAMRELAGLLFDTENTTRLLAVKCAIAAKTSEASLLLRAKCLAGDSQPTILADALTGVATVEGAEGLEFVSRFLSSRDEMIAESAALAIGESRAPEAFDLLNKAYHDIATLRIRGSILLGMAITRNPAAVDLLVEAIVSGSLPLASDAVRAGALFRQDEVVARRIEDALQSRQSRELIAEWKSATRSRP